MTKETDKRRQKYQEEEKNLLSSGYLNRSEYIKLAQRYIGLGSEEDIAHAERIINRDMEHYSPKDAAYTLILAGRAIEKTNPKKAIEFYERAAVIGKKDFKRHPVETSRKEGFWNYHAREPSSEYSRTQGFKGMIQSLELEKELYKRQGNEDKSEHTQKRIDKELERFKVRVIKNALRDIKSGKLDKARQRIPNHEDVCSIMRGYGVNIKDQEIDEIADKIEKRKGLEKSLYSASLVITGIVGIFFLSPNLTGNAIGNLTQTSSNIIGAVLFVVGIIGAFFYFRRR